MTDETSAKRPDWYRDETEPATERWWDGRAWTAHTRPALSVSRHPEQILPSSVAASKPLRGGVPVFAVVLIAVGALLIGAVGGGALGAIAGSATAAAGQVQAGSTAATTQAAASAPSAAPSSAFQYTTDMFTISLKVVSKQCFGSAGCDVSVEPVLSADTASIPADASGSLTYQIDGDESGPVTVTTNLTGTQYSQQQSDLSTSSSSKRITVEITNVETD